MILNIIINYVGEKNALEAEETSNIKSFFGIQAGGGQRAEARRIGASHARIRETGAPCRSVLRPMVGLSAENQLANCDCQD